MREENNNIMNAYNASVRAQPTRIFPAPLHLQFLQSGVKLSRGPRRLAPVA